MMMSRNLNDDAFSIRIWNIFAFLSAGRAININGIEENDVGFA